MAPETPEQSPPEIPEPLRAFYRDRPVLVTGGAGFIGSHLVDGLVDAGARVRVLDDLSYGRRENLARHLERDRPAVDFRHASILDRDALADAVEGVSVVFHEAALGSVPHSVEHPELYHDVNATGTLRVLLAARDARVDRVVYAASSSVYGDSPALPKVESMKPDPRSPYATAKLAGEDWVRTFASCYGLSGAVLRYFNIFGPRQRPDSQYAAVIPAFARALLTGGTPIIYGDGSQSRDFTHVTNVVRANLLAGASPKPLAGDTVNVACGAAYTVLHLLESMASILGVEPRHERRPPRTGEVQHSRADIALARDVLGYDPIVEFHAGLRDTLRAFRDELAD